MMASDKPNLNPVFVVIAGEPPNREYFVRLQIRNQGFKIGHSYLEGKDEEAEKCAEMLAAMLRKALEAFVMESMDGAAALVTIEDDPICTTTEHAFHLAAIAYAKDRVSVQLNERMAHGQETKRSPS